ncbi:MAG: radical SAM protein [Acidobacteria bacterium]|nr:radical SAM protein [Acidobacteriota bacterium]MDA1234298.1 radical SAM protein [Acidobacteriota bacterium]
MLIESYIPSATVPSLVGIARLAAESPVISAKRQVEYRSLESRSVLNRCSNPRMPFSWTINPYRGCEIGCRYCYARYTHEFMGMEDGKLFETRIYAKSEAAALLRRDLRRPIAGAIAMGTSTDPYQPAEKKFLVTRELFEVFAEGSGRELSITTKGDGVVRDLDLLQAISQRNRLSVNITITTVDADLARLLEPLAPRPDLRLAALSALADAGIQTGVFASPILPWITDATGQLEDLGRAAQDAGARYLTGGTLFLKDSARQEFFPLLRDHFPHLVSDYERLYRWDAYPKGGRVERIERTLREVRERFGLRAAAVFAGPLINSQLSLFD